MDIRWERYTHCSDVSEVKNWKDLFEKWDRSIRSQNWIKKSSLLVELFLPVDGGHPVHGRNITPSWFDICIGGCCVDAIFARGEGEGEAEMPCASPPPPAPIFIRVSARPTCIINVAQIVRGQVGIRGAIALESNAGFRQKCCVAVCELARSFARYKLRPGFAPVHRPAHGLRRGSNRARPYRSCVCAPVYMRLYDSCHVQGFRSLLPAITVARRARIIALIVSTRELDTRVTRAVKDNFGGGPYLGIK